MKAFRSLAALAIFAALATLGLASCAWAPIPGTPCAAPDEACWRTALEAHPVRRAAFWQDALARAPADRVGSAPPELVEYMLWDNLQHGYPERPRAAVLEPEFLADVRAAMADLPASVRNLFDKSLLGIYMLEDLGGTGFTDAGRDPSANRPLGGFIVLDAAVLRQRTANQWATWKENTPFRPSPDWQLRARIEEGAQDSRRNAIQYILLHELGHVLSIGRDVHPPFYQDTKDLPPGARFPFFEQSWRLDREREKELVLPAQDFPQRASVSYYFGAKLDAADMAPTYANLAKTNFPSLYAATRGGDDFAEAFASYVHVVLMKRPWEITISRGGETVTTFRACWDEPRCAGKRALLERILQRAD